MSQDPTQGGAAAPGAASAPQPSAQATLTPPAPLVLAQGLPFPQADGAAGLSFDIGPGLSLVCGGEGRGKTALLRLLAGELAPTAGQLQRHAALVFWEQPTDPRHDPVPAAAWLQALQARYPGWRESVVSSLASAWDLSEHLHKPLYMLSAGSRRKLGLLGAAASGAELCLLDTPYAALDPRSCRVLTEVLAEAADSPWQAWVVADYERPAAWAGLQLATLIDLGD